MARSWRKHEENTVKNLQPMTQWQNYLWGRGYIGYFMELKYFEICPIVSTAGFACDGSKVERPVTSESSHIIAFWACTLHNWVVSPALRRLAEESASNRYISWQIWLIYEEVWWTDSMKCSSHMSEKCVLFWFFSIQLIKKHTLNPEITILYQFHDQKWQVALVYLDPWCE